MKRLKGSQKAINRRASAHTLFIMKEHDSHRALDFALESVKHMRMHLSCLLISWLVFGNGVVSQTKTHIIKVNPGGGTTLRFDPETLIASVGSTIIWTFYPMNHSVVRADVKTPCKHLALNPKYSGFVPVSDTEHPIDMSMKLGRLRSLIQLEYSIDELLSWALVKIKDTTSQNK